jgi:lysozyme
MEDVSDFEECVEVYVKAPLAQHQYDALVSFALNVGCAALRDSTLLRRLNDRDYNAVPAQLMRWVYAGGRKRHGLINRRKSEVEQWRGGLN